MPWFRVNWYSPTLRIVHYVQAEDEDSAAEASAEDIHERLGVYPEDLDLELASVSLSRRPKGAKEEEEWGPEWGPEHE